MEQRFPLFKGDCNYDSTLLANNNTPAASSSYKYFNGGNSSYPIANQEWTQNSPKWKQLLEDEPSSQSMPFSSSSLPSQPSYNQSAFLLQNNQQTVLSLLSNVLNQSTSLHAKCEEISRMCSSFSNKELIELYPHLLVEMFGFSGSKAFGLNKLEPQKHSYDYAAAHNFLSTNGCLFKLINKLMVDQDAEFHFPYKGLPAGVIEKLKNGHISLWYQNKLLVLPGNEVVLSCNALEYYLLLFSYYVIHPQTLQETVGWSRIDDILYVRLLEDYLKYFYPIDSSNSSNIRIAHDKQQVSGLNLWSTSEYVLSNESRVSTINVPLQNILPSPSHAEIFLQILCDIWFGLNTEYSHQEQEYKLPSVDHSRVVRILVKYLHTFVNGCTELQMAAFSSATYTHVQQLDEFKSIVIPALMYKPLYFYLQHCFTHWPLDGSFRMILETWLSFIQPWRYRDTNTAMNESIELELSPWRSFIGENLLFYSSIFRVFLLRALRFDMTAFQDVHFVYRVAKVFSQYSLVDILREGVEQAIHNPVNIRSSGGPMFMSFMSTPKSFQIEQLGQTSQPLFGADIIRNVQEVCQLLSSTSISLRQRNLQCGYHERNVSHGVLTRIKEFFMVDDYSDFNHENQRKRHLELMDQSCSLLTAIFDLPELEARPSDSLSSNDTVAGGDTADLSLEKYSEADLPDFKLTDGGIELTDLGRYQILHGLRHFPVTYSGDPELQPVRSYESSVAVKYLYCIATKLNKKYGHQLEELYNGSGYIGRLFRQTTKKLQSNHYMDTPFKLPLSPVAQTEYVSPRISLRFAASYYFLGYVCMILVLARFFGFSWLSILFTLLLFGVAFLLVHVDSPPKKLKAR